MPTIEELAADIDFLKRRASVPNSLPPAAAAQRLLDGHGGTPGGDSPTLG